LGGGEIQLIPLKDFVYFVFLICESKKTFEYQ